MATLRIVSHLWVMSLLCLLFFQHDTHLALLLVYTFHSSENMHDATHIMMIINIATSVWLIDFCHNPIYQVILVHGNPQKRRTMFGGYLINYCCVKYQTFHEVCEKASQ